MAETASTGITGEQTTPQQSNEQYQEPNTQVQAGNIQTSGLETAENEKKYSDADVNTLIDKKFSEWQQKQQKAVDEAAKLAKMDAQQKAEYDRDQLQKQLDELTQKEMISEMTKTARGILAGQELNVSDELLAVLVTPDAEKTKAAIDSIATLLKSEIEKGVKDKLRGGTPKAGVKTSGMSKEQIIEIKDPIERQKAILQNKELFGL